MWHHGAILLRPSIHLEGVRKPTTILSQLTGCTSPDFNSGRLPKDLEHVSLGYNTSLFVYRAPKYNVVNCSKLKRSVGPNSTLLLGRN